MINSELCFYNEANEVQNFLDATTDLDRLFQKLKPLYLKHSKKLNMFDNEIDVIETITPLEIAALSNKIEHLNVILASLPNARTPRRTASLNNMQPVEAFFRALSHGHYAIANVLLDLSEVMKGVSDVKIKLATPGNRQPSAYQSYLERIQHPNQYRRLSKRLPNNGNVALIMAATLGHSELFLRLMTIDSIQQQLPESGIQAFLCATTTPDGFNKQEPQLQHDIVDYLLACPEVFAFAYSRAFDFSALLETVMQKRLSQLHSDPTAISRMNERDIKTCVYFMLYLIEYNPCFALTEIEFLLTLESVQRAINKPLHLPGEFALTRNENGLLHWAIKHQNQAVTDLLLKNIADIPTSNQKHQMYGYGAALPQSSQFFKTLASNISSRCSENSLSTLAESTWPSELDLCACASALTVDMNADNSINEIESPSCR